ncbi:hypothetical protein AAVH_12907 [Aphelenchoides avenae]|nr:hypothetical protein AAVH_12907 [Aphelenchus avenae]
MLSSMSLSRIISTLALVLASVNGNSAQNANGGGAMPSFPLKLSGDVENAVYTLDVTIGSQTFNLTLDTTALSSVLFEKRYAPQIGKCGGNVEKGVQRNFFDPT